MFLKFNNEEVLYKVQISNLVEKLCEGLEQATVWRGKPGALSEKDIGF
jgi:hypothetical protein